MHVKLYDVPELCLKKFDLLKSLLNIHVLHSQTCFYSQRRKSALHPLKHAALPVSFIHPLRQI